MIKSIYIGLCRIEQLQDTSGKDFEIAPGETLPTFEAVIACHATSPIQYDEIVTSLLPDLNYRLLRAEDVMLIGTWFETKGFSIKISALANAIMEGSRLEIGDIWPVEFGQTHGLDGIGEALENQSSLRVSAQTIRPLPDQTPIWPSDERLWIGDDLKHLLFAQDKPDEFIRTYFVVDATLRRKITKFFDLDMPFRKYATGSEYIDGPRGNWGHLECQCLFKGKAKEELKEIAPYLMDITLPDRAYGEAKFVPSFHRNFFASAWNPKIYAESGGMTHLETGIFIRTKDEFDVVWRRLRKFTRLQDDEGKWVLARFWDPRITHAFVQGLSPVQSANLLDRDTWILHTAGQTLTDPSLAQTLHHAQPQLREGAGPPKLDARLRESLKAMQFDKFFGRVQLALIKRYPNKSINFAHVKKLLRQAQGAGYTVEFALWGIALAWTHLNFNDEELRARVLEVAKLNLGQVDRIKIILNSLNLEA